MLARAIKILPRGEQTFHKKGGLDEIAAIVEPSENRKRLPGVAIHEVRPDAVIARRFLEKRDNLSEPFESLFAGDEPSIYANDQRLSLIHIYIKLRRNLTINAGIRYSYFSPLSSKEGNMFVATPGAGSAYITGLTVHKGNAWNAQKDNIGPQRCV